MDNNVYKEFNPPYIRLKSIFPVNYTISEEVIGKPFYDPEWIGSETFKKEEWNIVRDVCIEMFLYEKLTVESSMPFRCHSQS